MEKSLVTFSFDTLSKIARKTRFCRTYTKSNSSAVVFLCRQGLCNYVAPRIAWRTPAHQADARLFLQDNLHDSLLRKPLGFLRVPEDAPSVMVYKSFLIDHHFCSFRGIFTPFWAISWQITRPSNGEPVARSFFMPQKSVISHLKSVGR